MRVNQKVQVKARHKFHANRIGYFQFYAQNGGKNVAVMSTTLNDEGFFDGKDWVGRVLFAADPEDIHPV